MSYQVKEIFYTLQGEGANAGKPAVFCRFAGCNLWSGRESDRASAVCQFCDTDFVGTDGSLGARYDNAAALAAQIEKLWPEGEVGSRFVVLTGGEPLLQRNALTLMRALCDDGFTVLLETSGAHDITPVDPRVRRIMDLKCPGSGEVARNRWENLPHLKSTDEIKFVITTREDYEWAKERILEHKLASICPLLFSWAHPLAPEQRDKSLKQVPSGQTPIMRQELAEKIIADALPVRFQVQLHKVIWPSEQRGV